MQLTEFYNEVSRRTDTLNTQINVAETKRVLSEAFLLLSSLPPEEAMQVVTDGIKKAKSK